MARRVQLIINPAAAASRDQSARLERLVTSLEAAGFSITRRPTRAAGEAVELARTAADCDIVVAVGGDGTASEVASGLTARGPGAPSMGIAAFGTGNDMAQLAQTRNDSELVESIRSGAERLFDVISVRCESGGAVIERAALLFAAAGFATELLKQTTPKVKRWFGPKLCYSVGFFRALFLYRAPLIRAQAPGVDVSERLLLACAANSPHAGGGMMQLGPGARLDDGVMNLSLIRQATRFEAAVQFPRLLRGTHIGHPKVRYFTGTELTLTADRPVEIAIDGDLVGTTPAKFELKPGALRIVGRG